MSDHPIQALFNRCEAKHGAPPTHDDDLAAHLAPLAHPLQHPPRYDHGYIRTHRSEPVPAPPPKQSVPGPITMGEPAGRDWSWAGITIMLAAFWGFILQAWGPDLVALIRAMVR